MADKTKVKADFRYTSIDLGVKGVDALTPEGAEVSQDQLKALSKAADKQGFIVEETDDGYVLRPRTRRDG